MIVPLLLNREKKQHRDQALEILSSYHSLFGHSWYVPSDGGGILGSSCLPDDKMSAGLQSFVGSPHKVFLASVESDHAYHGQLAVL